MKATEAKPLQVLGNVSQFIGPIYQRTYSWTLSECQQLWAYSQSVCPNPLGIGYQGNGDLELGIATLNEVPYALGLIRQSLERQLDNDEGAN